MRKLALPSIVVVAAALVLGARWSPATPSARAAAAAPVVDGDPGSTLAVQGSGTVRTVPDRLTVVLGVEHRAASARAAMEDNARATRALLDALAGQGVAERDVQTSQLSVSPTYDETGRRVTGYLVAHRVTVDLSDMARAGAVIDAASAAAGDAIRVDSVGFSVKDSAELTASARAEAVRGARARAEQLASAAGVTLGRVRSITEIGSGVPPTPWPMAKGGSADFAAPPIQPGTEELTVSVAVVYDIAR